MKKSVYIFVLVAVFGLVSSSSKTTDDKQPFTKFEIAPDVVSVPPPHLLQVEYKKTNKEVSLGNELAPKDVRDPPTITYKGDPHAFYTLIMTDPDAPSRKSPVSREWNHWLVGNIPGSDISKGEVLTEYVGSGPPKDTGLHRYVFLLYKQPEGKIKFEEAHKSNTDGKRGKFSTENFVKKYGLGNAVGGNFFEAQYDDSVPELHKQLGF